MQKIQIYRKVEERYTAAAQSDDRDYGQRVAIQFGYSTEELESIPLDANLGLSCGNPHALANLKEVRCSCQHQNRGRESIILTRTLDTG